MMYPASDTVPAGVPAFLGKLWILVDDPSNNDLIGWDPSGTSFHIYEQGRFAKEVLPYYFKHSNVASFIRQLNMYGFHKVSNVDQGSLKMEKDDMEFSHPYFVQGKKNLLMRIKRKIPLPKPEERKGPVSELTHVLTEVHALQGKQKNMNSKLESLKTENGALWREVAMLRTKHHKQQQIVNKLIQFLVTLVGSSHSVPGRKRGLPMLSDVSDTQIATKMPRYSSPLSIEVLNQQPPPYTVQLPRTPESVVTSPVDSVVIHELTDHSQMTSPVTISSPEPVKSSNSQCNTPSNVDTPRVSTESSSMVSPTSTPLIFSNTDTAPHNFAPVITLDLPEMTSQDLSNIATDLPDMPPPELTDMTQSYLADVCGPGQSQCEVTTPLSLTGCDADNDDVMSILKATQGEGECSGRRCNKVELTNHVDTLQTELDLLKDLLAVSQYSVDSNTLAGLFAPEYPMTFNSDLLQHLDKESQLGSTLNTPAMPEAGGSNADVLPTPDIPSTNTGSQELVQYTAGTDIQNLFDNVLDDNWYGGDGDQPADQSTTTFDLPDCLNTPPVGSTISFPKSEPNLLDGNGSMTTEEID